MGSSRSTSLILADTSAWVEYLRKTGSPENIALRTLAAGAGEGGSLAVTEVVVMELLSGARDDHGARELRDMLNGVELLPLGGMDDFEHAAAIFRACARAGRRVRGLDDCLIAAVAMRAGAAVLHRDRDFDTIARCTGLEIAPA